MKIIALADIHMACSRLTEIDGLTEADLVIALGDITNFGSRSEAKSVLNKILSYNEKLLCLAGNLDNSEINTYFDDLGMNLHGQAHLVSHIHETRGADTIGSTPVVNPGMLANDGWVSIAVDKKDFKFTLP